MEPMKPRITKSTATAAMTAMFPTTADLLKRFELAKGQANLWDGERDGLREVVKTLKAGRYDDVLLYKTESAPVLYPNAEGKHQLENCLQTSIPAKVTEYGGEVIALALPVDTPEELLDAILHQLQKSKADALAYLSTSWLGSGVVELNSTLFEKKGSEKATITVLPDEFE
jgi:ABC-type amino acid transport substrate-binding protein